LIRGKKEQETKSKFFGGTVRPCNPGWEALGDVWPWQFMLLGPYF